MSYLISDQEHASAQCESAPVCPHGYTDDEHCEACTARTVLWIAQKRCERAAEHRRPA